MGGATAAEAGLSVRRLGVVETPPREVTSTCHAALTRYLQSHGVAVEAREDVAVHLWNATPAARRSVRAVLSSITVLDPACGTGNFLLAMLDLLEQCIAATAEDRDSPAGRRLLRREIATRQLFGVDVRAEAVAAARRALADVSGLAATALRSHIRHGDSLLERCGFSWASLESAGCGGFDLIIGNPPYVRHERIADPLLLLRPPVYKKAIRAALERVVPAGRHGLDGRADLAFLFTLAALSHLRSDGVLAFVLPAAVFESRYGQDLGRHLTTTGREGEILEERDRRAFSQVAVNTVMLTVSPAVSIPGTVRRACAAPGRSSGRTAAADPAALRRRLLERLDGRLTPLDRLGDVRYAVKTGINRFFYLDRDEARRWGIEPEFCRPVLRSPREVRRVVLHGDELRTVLFACDLAPEDLAAAGKRGALRYIAWGSRQSTANGIPWPLVPSLRSRGRWYAVPLPRPASILCPRFFDRRIFFVHPTTSVLEDQTFYGLALPDERRELIAALLNCTITCFLVESGGRSGLGEGARQYALCDLRALPCPNPGTVSPDAAVPIMEAYRSVAGREILSVEREIRQPDRLALDRAVARTLGLPERELEAIRESLVDAVRLRVERAAGR